MTLPTNAELKQAGEFLKSKGYLPVELSALSYWMAPGSAHWVSTLTACGMELIKSWRKDN